MKLHVLEICYISLVQYRKRKCSIVINEAFRTLQSLIMSFQINFHQVIFEGIQLKSITYLLRSLVPTWHIAPPQNLSIRYAGQLPALLQISFGQPTRLRPGEFQSRVSSAISLPIHLYLVADPPPLPSKNCQLHSLESCSFPQLDVADPVCPENAQYAPEISVDKYLQAGYDGKCRFLGSPI